MISLEKKKPINLTKTIATLNQIKVGLSWDDVKLNGQSPDCDASVFMLGENGKIPDESSFVFYNNLVSGDGSVRHNGDNRTGAGDGDDESIDVTLSQVNHSVLQIVIAITINNTEVGFDFSSVSNACVRIYNMANNSVICQYELTEAFASCDSLLIGRFYRSGNDWEFEAMGQAFEGGLEATVALYA